jgi:nucleoside phosphorylase/CheY-like chemotaxis protein
MRSLVVEDKTEKLRSIAQVLENSGSDVDHASNRSSAVSMLQDSSYDLLVIDIALPRSASDTPDRRGGLELMRSIEEHETVYTPGHIIGITAYTDIIEDFEDRFSRDGISLIKYDKSSDIWEERLHSLSERIILSNKQSDNEYKSHAVIICAVENEKRQVLRNGWGWSQANRFDDISPYYISKIGKPGGKRVYLTSPPRMGLVPASVSAMKSIEVFRPKYLIMCGMMAGIKGRASMGDVVVADPVWNWESGKWISDKGKNTFKAAPYQRRLAQPMRNKVDHLIESKWIEGAHDEWPGSKPDAAPDVRRGPVVSGSSVIASSDQLPQMKEQHRELLGLEMETYALHVASEECTPPRPLALSAKSVVDYADSNKPDTYHPYSSFISAQFISRLLVKYTLEG